MPKQASLPLNSSAGQNRTKLRQRKEALSRKLTGRGTTVLSDFGRIVTNVPHKNAYPLKFYMTRHNVLAEPLKDWLRERYLDGRRKNTLYEVRTYTGADGKPYVDYVLLQSLSPVERTKLTLEFGQITEDKVVRDGKKRRPRLNKDEKKEFDAMVADYYRRVEERRAAERAAQEELV
jgi:hypothetical protein